MRTLLKKTPVEIYSLQKHKIFVKREDLCGISGSPTFSKIRGIVEHLKALKSQGINIVGYTETSISMAGWGVAWACDMLGMKAVLFDPQYKVTPEVLQYHREQWAATKAEIIPIKAGMAAVNFHISKNLLREKYGAAAVLLPLGLSFEETIAATSKEVQETMKNLKNVSTIVVNIGSGTIAAGLWRGLDEIKFSGTLYGILGRTSNLKQKNNKIEQKAKIKQDGFFASKVQVKWIDPGWQYTEKSEMVCPFPCHPYYDLKAWQWLCENVDNLKDNILFWNIGH